MSQMLVRKARQMSEINLPRPTILVLPGPVGFQQIFFYIYAAYFFFFYTTTFCLLFSQFFKNTLSYCTPLLLNVCVFVRSFLAQERKEISELSVLQIRKS